MYSDYSNWTLGELQWEYDFLNVASVCDADTQQVYGEWVKE